MTKTADSFFSLTPAKRDLFSGGTPTDNVQSVRIPEGSLLPDDPKVRQAIETAAAKHKINPALLFALGQQESTYNPNAVGPPTKWGTAKGMFQYLDDTAKGRGIDPFNYEQAADAAAADMAEYILKRGVDGAVAQHHGGPNLKIHGKKTRQYTREVLAKAQAIAKELGIEFTAPEGTAKDYSVKPKPRADSFFGTPSKSAAVSVDNAPVAEEESLLKTAVGRLGGGPDGEFPESFGEAVGNLAMSGPRAVKRTIERGWEGIQNALNNDTEEVVLTPDEVRREIAATPWYDRQTMLDTDIDKLTPAQRTRVVSKKTVDQEEREWTERLRTNPKDAYLLPKRLEHLRQAPDDSRFAPATTFKGAMQRIISGHKNPIELLLQDSIPANAITYLATLPETERIKFDQARNVTRALEVDSDPNATAEEQKWSAEQLGTWDAKVNPSIKRAWTQLYDAAKTNPGQIGQAFSEALFADPYMVAAPAGVGLKVARTTQKIVAGTKAATIAGRVAKMADQIIDGAVTAGTLNVTAGAMENLATTGTVNQDEVKLNAAMGALFGGGLAPLFMKGAKAKSKLHDTNKLRADGTLDEAMADAAKADVELETQVSQAFDEDFGVGAKESAIQKQLRELFGLRNKQEAKAWVAQRRKEVKETFANESDYADYLQYVADEKLQRAGELADAAEAKAAREAADAEMSSAEAAVRREAMESDYNKAIEARNALEASDKEAAWAAHESAQKFAQKMDADDLMDALYTQDHPTIRQTENSIKRRDATLNTPKWRRGEASPELLAALGITAAGATAGAAMFPNDPKKGMLAGAIVSGLGIAGLGRARGSRAGGVRSIISQQGAIKPKGGNWETGSAEKIAPYDLGLLNPETGTAPDLDQQVIKSTQRYLQRYAGTVDDPLNDIVLPDGTRWETAMDKVIKKGKHPDFDEPLWAIENADNMSAEGRAVLKIENYMSHVSDYLRTLPESEVAKMDFVRMVKETKRWDERNAKKMESANVKYFKDATVLKEYPDGFKWIQLDKPGQFANESDLMGHSVRGYEPVKKESRSLDEYNYGQDWLDEAETILPDIDFESLDYAEMRDVLLKHKKEQPATAKAVDSLLLKLDDITKGHPDWQPDSVGGYQDYGYGGWDAIKNDKARVYSLRNEKGKPVATVELGKRGGLWNISQVKGPRNEPVKKIYADKVKDFTDFVYNDLDGDIGPALRDLEQMHKQAGKADPETLARLGVVGVGAAAGAYAFPEDKKLEGVLFGGFAGLVAPAGGTVLRRMKQSGAISSDGQIIAALTKAGKLANKLEEPEIKARDTAWMDQARVGDQQGFSQLYNTYFNKVKRFATKYTANRESWLGVDAEDVAQMAFVKAFKKIKEDPDFNIDNFPAFVTTIAENEAKNALTARKADMRGGEAKVVNEEVPAGRDAYEGDSTSGFSLIDKYSDTPGFDVGTSGALDTPEAMAVRDQTLDIVRQALNGLSEDVQQVFSLVHLEHYTLEEAAEVMGISKSGAWHQLRRAENRVAENVAKDKLKYGEEVRGPRNQRGSADPETLRKTAAITAAATVGGTAGYFLYDGDPWKSAVAGGFGAAGGALLAAGGGKGLTKALRGIDYRMKEFGPTLYGAAKRHGYQELKGIREYNNATGDFITMFGNLPKEVKPAMVRALSTRNKVIIDKMLEHFGGKPFREAFEKVRVKLDEIEDKLVEYGLIKKSEKDYFPFRVKDLDGLRKELGIEASSAIDSALATAEKRMQEKAGRPLNEIERGIVINKVLEPYLGKPTAGHMPGFAKARTIQEIPEKLQKYYYDPVETLNSYGVQSVKYIERAKFFGKHLVKKKEGNQEFVDISASIGEMVDDLKKKGEMDDQQAFELANLLQDRFGGGEKGSHPILSGMKNLVNASLLGHVASAAVQLGDIAMQGAVHGPRASIKALRRQLMRDKLKKLDDFGLNEHVAHEFLSDGWTRKVSDWSFKWGGFRAIDATGKNFGINASIEKMMREARTPEGQMKLSERYQRFFPEEYPKALSALKKGEINEAVELLAFTDLTKTQPLTQWELPQFYQKFPNGRVLYHLQTFSLRVLNMVYEDALKDITSMNFKRAAKGTKNLLAIGAVLGVQGATTDQLKNLMAGKPIDLGFSQIPVNALEALGLSLYDYNKIADKGPLQGFAESKMPPILRMSNDLLNEPERSLRYIPVVGRAAYDYFKEPLEAHRKERRKQQGYKMEIKVPPKETSDRGSGRTKRTERKRRER